MKFDTLKLGDTEVIRGLFTETFTDSEGPSEGVLVGNLAQELMTETGARDIYGFVAVEAEKTIGCIFFTRLTFGNDINAFLLAPVAIHPDYQGQGIGQGLIGFGIKKLKANGVELVMTYGDPGFYSKVGFKPVSEATVNPPLQLSLPEGWLGQSLAGDSVNPATGRPACVKAFNKPEYW
jgi:putative acetyltransferase